MIEKLIQQTNSFIDKLYHDVERCEDHHIYQRMWEHNNSLLFIVHHVKSNRIDQLEKFYDYSRTQTDFDLHNFYMNILALIRFNFHPEICKSLLVQLLNKENNRTDLIDLLPLDLFREIKRYNPVTYERRLKKIMSKQEEERLQHISDSPQGYSEVTLVIATYFQNGLVKKSHQEAWARILDIVGRHNLDFYRVIDMMLSKIVESLSSPSTHQQLAILQNISFESFIALISKNMMRQDQEWPRELVGTDSLLALVNESAESLFEKGISFYHPKYLELIRVLISRDTFGFQLFQPHFCCLTTQQVAKFEAERMGAVQEKIDDLYCSYNQSKNDQLTLGQALYCFRLSLMSQCVRANNFEKFHQLYITIWPSGRFDLIVHAPLIRELCLLIEWIIEPIYNKYYTSRFKKNKPIKSDKQGGYFKQYAQVNDGLFEDLQAILSYLQVNIGFSIKTVVKLIRVFKIILKGNSFKIQWHKLYEFKSIIKNIVQINLLPAITFHEHNPSLAFELYALLQQYSQEERFQLYYYYYNEVMFHHPYLAKTMQSIKNQIKVINALNFKNEEIINAQICYLSKGQHNKCFHNSVYILKRALSVNYCQQDHIYAKAIGRSTPFAADVMMFIVLNQTFAISDNTKQQNLLAEFIYSLFLHCPHLDIGIFVKLILQKMGSEDTQEFSMGWRLLKFIIDSIFPSLVEFASSKRLQFLTYGYHLKLDILDKIKVFDNSKHIRSRLYAALSAQHISTDNTQHSLLYYFIYTIFSRINRLTTSNIPLQSLGPQLDQCTEFLANLVRFYAYQTNRIRERNSKRQLEASYICFTENQLIQLITQNRSNFLQPIACQILRTIKKQQLLFTTKMLEPIPLKKLWEKIYKDYTFTAKTLPQILTNDAAKSNLFIHSDFYFYFWNCELENIWQSKDVYQGKLDDLRRIIAKDDMFHAGSDSLDKENMARYRLTYEMIEKEKDEMTQYYQKFNIMPPIINNTNKPTYERLSKFTIPPIFIKQKDEAAFSEFISLLFLHCLFPRMIIDFTQAIFCSKMVFKIIKENKLPSNKALIMIFNLLEAAISYVLHSTQREAQCIAVFTSDFLTIFSEWDKMEELSVKLQNEIGMERFNQKRYEKLKDFINHFETKVIGILMSHSQQPYVINNCLRFIEKNENLPLSQGQVQKLVKHLSTINVDTGTKLYAYIKILSSILENRKKRLGSFATASYSKQLQKYGITPQVSQLPPSKPKIYKQQEIKKSKKKSYINIQ